MKYLLLLFVILMCGCVSHGSWVKYDEVKLKYGDEITFYRRSQQPWILFFPIVADIPDQVGAQYYDGKIIALEKFNWFN